MKEYEVDIYTEKEALPCLLEGNFFHSSELFRIIENTPNDVPYMAVATQEGKVVAQMLVIQHRCGSWFPPYLYTHAHAHDEGLYAEGANKEAVFPLLLRAITIHLNKHLCFYIEFSELSKKMFGYRHFRNLGYFPVPWQEVHNSLHSLSPELRLSEKQAGIVQRMIKKGVESHEAKDDTEIHHFHTLLKNYYRFKPRRYVPDEKFFKQLRNSSHAKIYVTTYNNKVIGGYVCIYSQDNMHLWFAAFRRKRYLHLHPDTMTIWYALLHAYEQQARHLYFMDAGLPLSSNRYREFVLSFGGKPVATFRWFRFYTKFVNSLLHWWYKD